MSTVRTLIILRGLPGSGKSHYVDDLWDAHIWSEKIYRCSADDYFTCDWQHNNTKFYKFDPSLLGEAHAWCRAQADTVMSLNIDTVIIDNTNTQKWEYAPYLEMAEAYAYRTKIVMIGNLDDIELYAKRNTHGVPLTAIKKMAERFEK